MPKPLAADEALEALETAAELQDEPWLAARDTALFTMLYGCGLRLGEALSLNRRDVPKGETMVVTGKGRKQRVVPVLPVVAAALADYLSLCPFAHGEDAPLFVGARGKRLNPGVVQRQMRRLRALLGLPATATPHALRHSFATHLLAGGRSAHHPGTLGTRLAQHHAAVHPGRSGAAVRNLPAGSSAGEGLGVAQA